MHLWCAGATVSSSNIKLGKWTIMSNILSLAQTKVNSPTSTLRFLRDFLARSGAHRNDGLDFKSLCIVGTGCNSQIKLHFLLHFLNLTSIVWYIWHSFLLKNLEKDLLQLINKCEQNFFSSGW